MASTLRKMAAASGSTMEKASRTGSSVLSDAETFAAEILYRAQLSEDEFPSDLGTGFLTKHCAALDKYKVSKLVERASEELNYAQGRAAREAAIAVASASSSKNASSSENALSSEKPTSSENALVTENASESSNLGSQIKMNVFLKFPKRGMRQNDQGRFHNIDTGLIIPTEVAQAAMQAGVPTIAHHIGKRKKPVPEHAASAGKSLLKARKETESKAKTENRITNENRFAAFMLKMEPERYKKTMKTLKESANEFRRRSKGMGGGRKMNRTRKYRK